MKKDFDEIIESYLIIPSTEIRNIIREELEPITEKIEEIREDILRLPEKINNYNITAENYYALEGKFVKGSNGYYRKVFKDEDGILFIQLNRNQFEEIIHENISEILYKNDKKEKRPSIIKLN